MAALTTWLQKSMSYSTSAGLNRKRSPIIFFTSLSGDFVKKGMIMLPRGLKLRTAEAPGGTGPRRLGAPIGQAIKFDIMPLF